MKLIVRNAKGVNIRTAPVDGGIIKLALAGTELEYDSTVEINGNLYAKLKDPMLYQGKPSPAYVVVKANLVQYCWFVTETVEAPSDYVRGWNDCLDAIKVPGRK